jgi:hypothetical protein
MRHFRITRQGIVAGVAALSLAACQTPNEGDVARAKPDARQGPEVSRICFSQQIRSWKANDSRSIIVEKNRNEEFKLDLAGPCNPDDAFMNVGLVSRFGGGSCLTSGDRLVTDSRFSGGSCTIHRIYQWLPEATDTAPGAASDKSPQAS